MVDTTLPGVFLKGVAASRPAANAVAAGSVYSATDTGAITQSDGISTWSTWATISSGMADPMTTRGDMIIRNAANATARLGRGSAAEVLTSDGTDIAWAAAATGAPTTADYLVGTAQGGLSAEIVAGTSPGGELGGTWGTPTVDTTHSGSSHVPAILLDFPLASDISNQAITVDTAFDIIANQNFTKAHAGSLIEVIVRGYCFCNDAASNAYHISVVIDSAGTPITKYIGGSSNTSAVANERVNPFGGGANFFVSGLSAAVHTVKVQITATSANDHLYCRPVTGGPPTDGNEFANVQVIEHG